MFIVLKDHQLQYYKSTNEQQLGYPHGVINMNYFKVKLLAGDDKSGVSFNIQIKGHDQVFKFRGKTLKEANEWKAEIKRHIRASKGH